MMFEDSDQGKVFLHVRPAVEKLVGYLGMLKCNPAKKRLGKRWTNIISLNIFKSVPSRMSFIVDAYSFWLIWNFLRTNVRSLEMNWRFKLHDGDKNLEALSVSRTISRTFVSIFQNIICKIL